MSFIVRKNIFRGYASTVCTFVTKPGMRVKIPTQSSKLYFGEIPVEVSKSKEIIVPEITPGTYAIFDNTKHQVIATAILLKPEHMLEIDEAPLIFQRSEENTYLFPLEAKVSVKALRATQQYKHSVAFVSQRNDSVVNN